MDTCEYIVGAVYICCEYRDIAFFVEALSAAGGGDAAGGGVFFVAVAAFGAADAAGGGVFFLAVFSFVFNITFSNRPKSSWHLATLDFFFGEGPPRPRRLRDLVVGSPTYIYIYMKYMQQYIS